MVSGSHILSVICIAHRHLSKSPFKTGDKSENWGKFEPATTVEESNSFYIADCVQTEICFTGIENLTFMNIKYELKQNT